MSNPRRRFLQSAAGVAAGMTFPCDHDAATLESQAGSSAPATSSQPMPTVRLGNYQVSRLIVGANPFYGFSHFNRLFSQHMVEWATPEHVCNTLRQCEAQGINTWQFSQVDRAFADLKRHREEGGKMQWLLLSHREMEDDHSQIKKIAALKPIGILHHGGSSERKRRSGKIGEVRDFLKAVRDSGVMVGLSTHDPSFLQEVEEQGWDIDFFMTALYYLTRSPEEYRKLLGQRPLGEVYLPEDPPRMYRAIRQTRKPCLCYKVLAAGRLTDSPQQIDQAFKTTFDSIKPSDCIIIGMYPKYTDQVRENAERVRKFAATRMTSSAAGA